MASQHTLVPTALPLSDHCIYLAPSGAMRPYAKTPEFFRDAVYDPELATGRVLALHRVSTPQDVHFPIWEMHPEGDELIMLASGSVTVEFRDADGSTTALGPSSAIVVPAGAWHRIVVHEPSTLIAITPRRNTAHEHP